YWKNPGDSGEATRIDWTLPDGVTAGELQWPTPHRIPYSGFINYGYENQVHHVLTLAVDQDVSSGTNLTLSADATWLVCEDICIPETATFTLSLPVMSAAPARNASAPDWYGEALAALPADAGPIRARSAGDELILELTNLPALSDAYFFPDAWGVVEPGAKQTFEDGTLRLPGGVLAASGPTSGVLTGTTVAGAAYAATIRLSSGVPAETLPARQTGGVLRAVWFAVLGGLLLNLMPCVFPVLSMKALHLVGGATDQHDRRMEGIAYTAGVLVFFALLGGALLTLRSGGAAIGWGFQMQSPLIVGGIALVMFLIGLNLLGAFEVGTRMMGVGQALTARRGWVGSFFTGALAAVVATPCTAPFMAFALGVALTQPPAAAMAIILALGLGLALPFLLIALVPALASRLPSPGAWMVHFRQILAFPMFGACVWLAWVVAVQAGADGVLRLLAATVVAAFVVWLWPHRGRWPARIAGGAAVAACAVLITSLHTVTPKLATSGKHSTRGMPFTPERLAAARRDGKTVFVNQTAAWCLTCLVNEKNVLASEPIEAAFAEPGVAYLSGDWTQRDPAITAFLTEHGRSGVPLYVVYHGNAPGQILPQVLTQKIVLNALERP
ncbi:MAG: thioredoxin family protein, partial [Pseudomonadota bacterium]